MPECRVIAPDIPVAPKEALPFLHEYCKANDADLVIGTSMGGMYAMQLTDYPRICVNPALYMSRLTDIMKVGTFDYFRPTADGRSQYTITGDIIQHFRGGRYHPCREENTGISMNYVDRLHSKQLSLYYENENRCNDWSNSR